MNFRAGAKKLREARKRLLAGSWRISEFLSDYFAWLHRAHGNGVVLLCAGDGGFGAGLLVERRQRGLVTGFQCVNLVADYEGILRTLAHAGPGASGIISGHGMLGAAHGVADSSGVGLSAWRQTRRQLPELEPATAAESIHFQVSSTHPDSPFLIGGLMPNCAGPATPFQQYSITQRCANGEKVTSIDSKTRGAQARTPLIMPGWMGEGPGKIKGLANVRVARVTCFGHAPSMGKGFVPKNEQAGQRSRSTWVPSPCRSSRRRRFCPARWL